MEWSEMPSQREEYRGMETKEKRGKIVEEMGVHQVGEQER